MLDEITRKNYFKEAYELHSQGKISEAEEIYYGIIMQIPDDYEVLNLIGICRLSYGDFDGAESYVKKALALKEVQYFYETLARVYFEKHDYNMELSVRLKMYDLYGLDYESAFSLGLVYKNLRQYENAEKYYLIARDFDPKSRDLYFNMANLYTAWQKHEVAQTQLLQCIKLNRDDTEAKYFLSLNYMRLKNYKKGLPLFETRLCRQTAIDTTRHTYPELFEKAKFWNGRDIKTKTLFTYYEAGFGDMIMFARHIPKVLEKCGKLIIKPQIELSELFRINFPQAEIMDCYCDESTLDFDYHIPFLSIPYALKLDTTDMFEPCERYLKADYDKTEEYGDKYFDNDDLKIGIKWQGNTYYETDRVINIDAFEPVLRNPGVKVYSLQTFEGHEEFNKLAAKYDIIDLSPTFNNFADTAAAVENLDLIICNDTSLAHLAGAMGKRTAVLLPYNSNWRWHTNFDYCSWYKWLQTFRAEEGESWNSLIVRSIPKMGKFPDYLLGG